MNLIDFNQFLAVDIRSGTIVSAELFEKARNKSYKVSVDFGPDLGIKKTSAQITTHYSCEDLIGKQVCGLVNAGTKNIAGFISEFLLLGLSDSDGSIVLITPDKNVPNGMRLH